MQISKMSKCFLVLATVLTSLNSHADVRKFHCNNEEEETTVGEIYYEVSGEYSPERSALPIVTLTMKEVQNFGDKTLARYFVEKLQPESNLRGAVTYGFSVNMLRETKNVKIVFAQDAGRGLEARISVNGESLGWCTPLRQF